MNTKYSEWSIADHRQRIRIRHRIAEQMRSSSWRKTQGKSKHGLHQMTSNVKRSLNALATIMALLACLPSGANAARVELRPGGYIYPIKPDFVGPLPSWYPAFTSLCSSSFCVRLTYETGSIQVFAFVANQWPPTSIAWTQGAAWPAGYEAWNPTYSRVTMRPDGNLVLTNSQGVVLWQTNTFVPNSYLALDDNGLLAIYSPAGAMVWTTMPTTSLIENDPNAARPVAANPVSPTYPLNRSPIPAGQAPPVDYIRCNSAGIAGDIRNMLLVMGYSYPGLAYCQ